VRLPSSSLGPKEMLCKNSYQISQSTSVSCISQRKSTRSERLLSTEHQPYKTASSGADDEAAAELTSQLRSG
jgi:hypothetical protein